MSDLSDAILNQAVLELPRTLRMVLGALYIKPAPSHQA